MKECQRYFDVFEIDVQLTQALRLCIINPLFLTCLGSSPRVKIADSVAIAE